MFNELVRSADGLAQELDEFAAKNEARQAWVIRSERNGVWVRFGGEATTATASWFPSTTAGLPAGTMGWVFPLGGGKGLFVVASVWRPKTLRANASGFTVSTAGTYLVPGAAVTHANLTPGRTYDVSWLVSVMTGPQASGNHRAAPGVRITHRDGVSEDFLVGSYIDSTPTRSSTTWEWGGEYVANENGEITTAVILRWSAGQFVTLNTKITTTVS